MTLDHNITRREFLKRSRSLGIGLGVTPLALNVLSMFQQELSAQEPRRTELGREVDRKWYKTYDIDHTQCFICPLNCKLEAGQTCFCRTRQNHNGRLFSHAYNNPCIISLDPIEKLPLHHYLPGANTLCLAVGGCNLRCLYCQNWQQSQSKPEELKTFDLPKEKAFEGARKKDCRIIAHTYTEPVAFYEYMLDIAAYSKPKGVRNVAASAFFINPEPLKELCRVIDAFAVALKGFDEKFYDKVLGAQIKPVLKAIETLAAERKWFEIVTLIVPSYNDDPAKIKAMCQWLKKTVGTRVPLHFGRFVPEYKMKDIPRTPIPSLEKCWQIAKDEGLEYVYIFNVPGHQANNTFCHNCNQQIIKRLGIKTLENHVVNGACPFCKTRIPGVWA